MAKIIGVVENIVTEVASWDGSPFVNPPGRTIILVADTHTAAVGWIWNPSTSTLYPTAPTVGFRRVEKIDFMRLFTIEERVRYNALRKITDGLTAAEYSSSDPMNQLFVALDIVFDSFDLAVMVELDHPETIQGLALLSAGGVFGSNVENQTVRTAQVLAGQMPT